MASAKDSLKALLEQKAEFERQIQALKHQIEGLDIAIGIVEGGAVKATEANRFSVKAYVLDLLKERGAEGLNANLAVEIAAQRNQKLDRASVASLLSRLKQEETLTHDGAVYRLKDIPKLRITDAADRDLTLEPLLPTRVRFRRDHEDPGRFVVVKR